MNDDSAETRKFGGIELCRFLCALAVVIYHFQQFFCSRVWIYAIDADVAGRAAYPLYGALAPFYHQGDSAVRVFWAISGFIFFWKYAEPIHDRTIDGAKFFVWRFAQLYPLHLLTLAVVAGLQALYLLGHKDYFIYPAGLAELPSQLLMWSNWLFSMPKSFNGPIWSVSVEVLTYGAFFALARLARPDARLRLAAVLAAFVLLTTPFGARVWDAANCALLFFGGGYVQLVVTRLAPSLRRPAFWIAVAAVVVSAVSTFHDGLAESNPTPSRMLFFVLAIVAAFALIEDALPLDLSRAGKLGELTYGSYLWHFPLQIALVLVVDAMGLSRASLLSPLVLALWLGATFALAAASHRYFELPAQTAIRAAYLKRIAKATQAPGAAEPVC